MSTKGDLVRELAAIDQRGRMTEDSSLLRNRQDRTHDLDTSHQVPPARCGLIASRARVAAFVHCIVVHPTLHGGN